MAAKSHNGFGAVGLAGTGAQFLYRVFALEEKVNSRLNDVAQILRDMANQNLDVINLSFSILGTCKNNIKKKCHYPIVSNFMIRHTINEIVRDYGTLFVVSAGNSSQEVDSYTLPSEGVLVVGSANHSFNISSYSNRGPGVDLYASDSLLFTLHGRQGVSRPSTEGTSFASPLVTASLGLLKQYAREHGVTLKPAEWTQILIDSSQFSTRLTKNNSSGRHLNFRQAALLTQSIVESRR